jgi:hypothetical protein
MNSSHRLNLWAKENSSPYLLETTNGKIYFFQKGKEISLISITRLIWWVYPPRLNLVLLQLLILAKMHLKPAQVT